MNQCFIKHYFPISSSLLKNEEETEFTFLDSLKLNKKGKEEFHSLGYKQWKHVILEQSTL